MEVVMQIPQEELYAAAKKALQDAAVDLVENGGGMFEPPIGPDAYVAKKYGLSVRKVAECRREMQKLPSMMKYLGDCAGMVTLEGFGVYLKYRGSLEWRKEMAKYVKKAG